MRTLLIILGIACVGLVQAQSPRDASVSQCRRNLRLIYDAIQEYQRTKGAYPPRLSELTPEFLNDTKYLVCPLAEIQSGRDSPRDNASEIGLPDPQTSYDYELGPDLLRSNVWGGAPKTSRDYKLKQRELVGDAVPMVRCRKHAKWQNLSFDRRVYESDLYWEVEVRHILPHPYLTPAWVFSDRLPIARRLAERAAELPSGCLDLTHFYNAHLQDEWLSNEVRTDNSLADFPAGLFRVGELVFDARGIVQLDGRCFSVPAFPDEIAIVPVAVKPKRIHLLHAVHSSDVHGVPLAQLILNYDGRIQRTIPIRYGIDVADWWFDPAGSDATDKLDNGNIVWTGTNEAARRKEKRLRLFHSTFANPLPETALQSVGFSSTGSHSALFLLAITCE